MTKISWSDYPILHEAHCMDWGLELLHEEELAQYWAELAVLEAAEQRGYAQMSAPIPGSQRLEGWDDIPF